VGTRIHSSSFVSEKAVVGDGTQIWLFCQVRDGARLGKECILGKGVYVDNDVTIGDRCKIQNNASIYHGVTIEDGVFVGPHVCFTNDKVPRATNPDLSLKSASDWTVSKTLVKTGAALGANSTIVCGVTIGKWAMVGSGAVVTKDVPDHGLVLGNPAKLVGYVCSCGRKVEIGAKCECGRTLLRGADGKVSST
jgi:UDP-2-acetamido-3-amino-2,3-dideoxy-glucuronate N-acetyltransferase